MTSGGFSSPLQIEVTARGVADALAQTGFFAVLRNKPPQAEVTLDQASNVRNSKSCLDGFQSLFDIVHRVVEVR